MATHPTHRMPSRVHTVKDVDFRRNFCKTDFRMPLGKDGVESSDGDGLTINSALFTSTQPVGEHGWMDHHKWFAYHKDPIVCDTGAETLFESSIANKQLYDPSMPCPVESSKNISDMFADPRLAHGTFQVIDPDSGVHAGFMLTDHVLYAVYGRNLRYTMVEHRGTNPDLCEPCRPVCNEQYGCNDFWKDCQYQEFKQNTTEREFRAFMVYCAWASTAEANGIKVTDWKKFSAWKKTTGPVGGMYSNEQFVAWKATNDYNEYCKFMKGWKDWYVQYLEHDSGVDVCATDTCNPGECSKRLFGEAPAGGCSAGECTSCYHIYASPDGKSCYEEGVSRPKEERPYQFGSCRSCCCSAPAQFTELIPVLRTEACDPLCDFYKVAIGIDRKYKTFKFFVNNQEVYKVVDVGRRLNDEFRVRELGGYPESVDIRRVLWGFGTGSMLDAAMPNNYNRFHAANNWRNDTYLLPLLPLDRYFNTYFDKCGQLQPLTDVQFSTVSKDMKYRVFRQGDVLKVKYVNITVRPAQRGYYSLANYCSYRSCQGFNSPMGDDECGCAGGGWDFGPCGPDPRDFNIEFIQDGNNGPIVPDSMAVNNDFQCDSKSTRARLVRVPKSKRYWQPTGCRDQQWGTSPY